MIRFPLVPPALLALIQYVASVALFAVKFLIYFDCGICRANNLGQFAKSQRSAGKTSLAQRSIDLSTLSWLRPPK